MSDKEIAGLRSADEPRAGFQIRPEQWRFPASQSNAFISVTGTISWEATGPQTKQMTVAVAPRAGEIPDKKAESAGAQSWGGLGAVRSGGVCSSARYQSGRDLNRVTETKQVIGLTASAFFRLVFGA